MLALVSCRGGSQQTEETDPVLVTVGDSALRLSEVTGKIPAGLAETDSTAIFDRIVDGWVRGQVLSRMVKADPADLERIEEMVSNYRTDLLMARYLKDKTSGRTGRKVKESAVRAYYRDHYSSIRLEQPLVKGVLIKVSEGSPRLDDLRAWMRRATPRDLQRIEQRALPELLQYENFQHRWVDWATISDQLPRDIYDADAFLSTHDNYEGSLGGNVYLLHIYDYEPSGSAVPYEYASSQIEALLERSADRDYERSLMRDLYREASSEGWLVPGVYDPVEGKMKSITNIEP